MKNPNINICLEWLSLQADAF